MRLITYQSVNGLQVGKVEGESVIALPGGDLLSLIERGPEGLTQARAVTGTSNNLAALTLCAPIPNPRRNIFCVGHNYAAHVAESLRAKGQPVKMPEIPVFFTKATTTVNAPYGDIPFDASVSTKIDWEAELGLVIGQPGKNIKRENALEHVFGYTVVNDISARDLQNSHGGQFFKGKSLDGACPMGPWIVTKDEVPNPHALRVTCKVNGELKQDSTTADFIFDIYALIEWLSKGLTLLPGDVIATGTPSGVGFARTPPEFLKPGDVVESAVEGIGMIRNRVVAA
jgi:2-keto-4-pentenoate hydratase/2-oxohepta-3-ene-1,7-dioic acid hydratase in catechol pathway